MTKFKKINGKNLPTPGPISIRQLLKDEKQKWAEEKINEIKEIQGDFIKDPFDEEHEFISKAKILEILKK